MKGKLYSSKNIEISYLDANLSSSDIYNPTTLKNSFELKIKQENSPLQIQGKWKNYILFRRDFENIGFIALRGKEGKSDSLFVMGLESIDPEILKNSLENNLCLNDIRDAFGIAYERDFKILKKESYK